MTRKHYKLLAEALRDSKPTDGPALSQWQRDVAAISRSLIGTNDHFDRSRFENAAGLYEEPR